MVTEHLVPSPSLKQEPFFTPNVPSQNTNKIETQKNNTLKEITLAANPIVCVYAPWRIVTHDFIHVPEQPYG